MCYFTHQMWCDDPFSQKNKTTERAMGGGSRGWGQQGRGLGQNFKMGVWQYSGSS